MVTIIKRTAFHLISWGHMWELVSFAKGNVRRLCLESLASGPKMPNAIAKASEVHISHVSRALRELTKKGLVECLTPATPKNRIYGITSRGKELLKRLGEMDKASMR